MGKNKKPQKTKELSVAIAEASSTGEEPKMLAVPPPLPPSQPQTPRKRGRPRKIIESELKNQEEIGAEAGITRATEEVIESEPKKVETRQAEVEEGEGELEQGQNKVVVEVPPASIEREPTRRSRRKKSKPRKSS